MILILESGYTDGYGFFKHHSERVDIKNARDIFSNLPLKNGEYKTLCLKNGESNDLVYYEFFSSSKCEIFNNKIHKLLLEYEQ